MYWSKSKVSCLHCTNYDIGKDSYIATAAGALANIDIAEYD